MHLTKHDISGLEKITRINLINSVTGIKPANLIGTISANGVANLAIFSSVVHLGSEPALIGFVLRPNNDVRRDTFENILETRSYTINQIHEPLAERAHYTSAKFEAGESEFEKCGIEEEYLFGFESPFVKTSKLKLGMNLVNTVRIEANGTSLVIGEIQHLEVTDDALREHGKVDLEKIRSVGISGLDSYYRLEKFASFPYARPSELPDFNADESNRR